MEVNIEFNIHDDLGTENRDIIESSCLTHDERITAMWSSSVLKFQSSSLIVDIIDRFEDQGFDIDGFESVSFNHHPNRA